MLVMGARGATGYVLGRGAGGAANWWEAGGATNCVAAYQPKGAASLAASYVNLANPGTYNAAPGVAPTWDAATGWTFNGTTQYLSSGVVPSVGWTILVRVVDAASSQARFACGTRRFGNGTALAPHHTNSGRRYYATGELLAGTTTSSGVMAAAGNNCYWNGGSEGTAPANSVAAWYPFAIGCVIDNGSPANYWHSSIQALAIYSAILSAAQVAAVTAAMQAL